MEWEASGAGYACCAFYAWAAFAWGSAMHARSPHGCNANQTDAVHAPALRVGATCVLPQGQSARGSSGDGSALPPRLPAGRPAVSQQTSGRLGGMGAAAGAAAASGPAYVPTPEEHQNDYTVLPIDLSRWVGFCEWGSPARPL